MPCNGELGLVDFGVVNANAVVAGLLQLRFFIDQLVKRLLRQDFGIWRRAAGRQLFRQAKLETLNFVVGNGFRVDHGHDEVCGAGFGRALCKHGAGKTAQTQPAQAQAHAQERLSQWRLVC